MGRIKNLKYTEGIELKNVKFYFIFTLAFTFVLFSLGFASSVASFQVTSFSCSPSEVVINSVFSCTAQVQNTGDASGSVSTATLYPDSNNWLENSNYPQSSGSSVSAGNSVDITFTGLRATKSGDNGFSKIMLDSVTDTYVADNNEKVNVIDVLVIISNSASSAAMGGTITTTTEVTAGGNIDVELTFASSSGGCSVGSQTNPKTISGMTDGSKQSRTWTITQGTSGNCVFTMSAAATGAGGVASKIDSSSSTITCSNCPTSSSSSGGGGGGSSSTSGAKTYNLGEFSAVRTVELLNSETTSFKIDGDEHVLTLLNHTETQATITLESQKQTFILDLGEEINVDLTGDNISDVSVKLKSINIASKKVTIILTKLVGGEKPADVGEGEEGTIGSESGRGGGEEKSKSTLTYVLIGVFVLLAVLAIYYANSQKKKRRYIGG